MKYITEPKKEIPVRYEADVFVAGGSCTGVFAAVRAARLGMKVVLVERQNCLGGTATAALVNVWHSLKDTDYKEQIIGGLTREITDRLIASGCAIEQDDPSLAIQFNPNRLQHELDQLVLEHHITVLFHTLCVGAMAADGKINAAIIENKDGRSAISAKFYIDATGDGDLAQYLDLPVYRHPVVQPPTPCFFLQGSTDGLNIEKLISEHGHEVGLPDDFGWYGPVPGIPNIYLRADFHVLGEDCASAEGLTHIEMEGRRKAFALVDLIRKYSDREVSVAALSSMAGIRESRHFKTSYQANGEELLHGLRYDDAILNGTYRVDMHDLEGNVTFKYLNGYSIRMSGAERRSVEWNWREEEGLTGEAPKYYQLPFRVLVQEQFENFIAAGRMVNADEQAFGALRVMVNLNQLGEAAGVAAALSVKKGQPVYQLDGSEVRKTLNEGGSLL
ncbi:MAG: FAD-dependent oxidoreductase [Clostridiales bacterium]|nr:FAD-dependent oxidoreductase [Clostridiales bacterium]